MTQIPRHLMPQIPKDKLKEFREYLKSCGINTSEDRKPLNWFKPIQKHVNLEKVNKFINDRARIDNAPLVVTEDGYLVDGHHRWVAANRLNLESLPVIMCSCPLKEFLKVAHEFDHSYVKSVNELTTYGRLALITESEPMLTEQAEQKLREYIREVIRTKLSEKKMQGKDPCWKGYEMVGKKKKNGREVPNCVPKK